MRRIVCALLLALTLASLPRASAFGQSAYVWDGAGGISALAIDPVTPSTVYAGIYGSGLFKSTDGGVSWSASALPNEPRVNVLAIDPQTPTTLYAGADSGVFRSADGGLSWERAELGESPVYHVAIDPITPITVYAAVRRGDGGALRKSTDGGTTWSDVLVVDGYYTQDYYCGWDCYYWTEYGAASISALVIDPVTPNVLYVAVSYQVTYWESDDWGNYYSCMPCYYSWSEVLSSSVEGTWTTTLTWGRPYWPGSDNVITALAIAPRIDPLSPATLYVTAPYDGGGLLKSVDSGQTWENIVLQDSPYDLVIDPLSPATVYAAGRGLSKTTDGATTWSTVGAGLSDTLLVYGTSSGIGINVLAIDPVTPATLYAGTTIGVFKTTDGGASWSRIGLGQRSLLGSISLDPAIVAGGSSSTGTVTLGAAAPAEGVTVTLSVSGADPSIISVPGSVTVPAGSTRAQFSISTRLTYFGGAWTTIAGTSDDAIRTTTLQVTPTPITTIVSAVNETGRAVTSGVLTVAKTITFGFTVTANVDVARFECKFGWNDFSPCTSPVTYAGLTPRADYDFTVRAVDTAGNVEAQPPSFRLHLGPPSANISPTRGPVGTRVELSGWGLDGVTAARLNALSAPIERDAGRLWVVVPPGAATGPLTLDWAGGSVTTSMLFTVADTVADGGPRITGVHPSSVRASGEIIIYGPNQVLGCAYDWGQNRWVCSEWPTVTIGGVAARPLSWGIYSNDLIVAAPARTVTGRVMVTTSRGSAMSESEVVVLADPVATSLLPAAGPVGAGVTIAGRDLDRVTDVRFKGARAAITSVSPTELTVSVPPGAINGGVTVHWPTGSTSAGSFTVTPGIVAIDPNPVFLGTPVTITGTNLMAFTGKPTVRVGGIAATVRPGGTPSQLQVTLPGTAVSGRVSVTTVDGSATSATELVVVRRPTVTSFGPTLGPVGTIVTVVGPNLAEVRGVQFNGIGAAIAPVSATLLKATVPPGATSGLITLLTQAGDVDSLTSFTVTPPSDLQIPAVTAPPSAATGRPIGVSTTVRNAGGSPVPASTLRLYLSTDPAGGLREDRDRLLATRTLGNVGIGAAVLVTTPTTIPADVSPGTYRIIARVEIAGAVPEGNTTNNVGVSGALTVTMYRPNLMVAALTPPARGAVGQPVTVPNSVRNIGPAPAGAFTVRFHLSDDEVFDAADPVIGQRTLSSLAAGGTSTTSTSLRLPATIAAGSYYVIAVADALEQQLEVDETNRVAMAGPFPVVLHQPDLAITAMTVPARSEVGRSLAVAHTVSNTGSGPAGTFTVRFHLSRDERLDGGDPLLGGRPVSGVAAGRASAATMSLQIPPIMPVGEYYVIAVVDAGERQAERDETNNITVSAPFSLVPFQPTVERRDEPPACLMKRSLGWKRPMNCPPYFDPSPGDGDV